MIVAELSGNHQGSLGQALNLVRAAKAAGADAVKLQTLNPDTITLKNGPNEHFRIKGGPWDGRHLYDLYKETQIPREWHHQLFMEGRRLGLKVFSTPFTPDDVDFLETLDCPIYKVASFEITDLPLIKRIARTGKPVIISTGMASLAEVMRVEQHFWDVTLLHCISEYPSPLEHANLGRLNDLKPICQDVGLSDHSMSPLPAVLAVGMGAKVIEKHLCLSRAAGGPDSGFSLEPSEFAEMVRMVRDAEKAMQPYEDPKPANLRFRKAIWVVQDVLSGEEITSDNVKVMRPAPEISLAPSFYDDILGARFNQPLQRGTPLVFSHIEGAHNLSTSTAAG